MFWELEMVFLNGLLSGAKSEQAQQKAGKIRIIFIIAVRIKLN
jgi:hypothetical protein